MALLFKDKVLKFNFVIGFLSWMNIFYYLHNFLFKVLWFKKLLKSTSLHYCYPIVSFLLKIQFLVSVMFGHLLFPYYVIFLHYEKEHSDSVSLLYEWMDLVKMLLAYDHALFFLSLIWHITLIAFYILNYL